MIIRVQVDFICLNNLIFQNEKSSLKPLKMPNLSGLDSWMAFVTLFVSKG